MTLRTKTKTINTIMWSTTFHLYFPWPWVRLYSNGSNHALRNAFVTLAITQWWHVIMAPAARRVCILDWHADDVGPDIIDLYILCHTLALTNNTDVTRLEGTRATPSPLKFIPAARINNDGDLNVCLSRIRGARSTGGINNHYHVTSYYHSSRFILIFG